MNTDSIENYRHPHYTDYVFKRTIQKYAKGVLKFLDIPYEIDYIILSEIASFGPSIHRLDFAGMVTNNFEELLLILECQSKLPNDDDISRFFQYVSSLRILKNRKVELYILCTEKAPYTKKQYKIKDDCVYDMHVISLKNFEAKEILKKMENKIENNIDIAEQDIAALQLIAYTSYEEPAIEILKKACEIVDKLDIADLNKESILYILEVLSVNMLDDDEKIRFMEDRKMLINPREDYFHKKGREEVKFEIAFKLLDEGMSISDICKVTGLTENQIQDSNNPMNHSQSIQ